MTIRVLLADDQAVVRAGLAMLVDSQPDMRVIAEAVDGRDAIIACRAHRPDVALMDIRMPGMDGIEATRRITAESGCRVVILTTYALDEYVYQALQAGASGFLLKRAQPAELLLGVRSAAAGDALIAPALTRALIESFLTSPAPRAAAPPELALLTPREREVFDLVIQGLTNAEIAARFVVAETTVKTHVTRTFDKLAIRDRVHAVLYAYDNGLATSAPGDGARSTAATRGRPERASRRRGER